MGGTAHEESSMSDAMHGYVSKIKTTADETIIEIRLPREHFAAAVTGYDSRNVVVMPAQIDAPFGPVELSEGEEPA